MKYSSEEDGPPKTIIKNITNNSKQHKPPKLTIRRAKLTIISVFAFLVVAQLFFGLNDWLGGRTSAQGGGTIRNGTAQGLTPAFLFEPEVPFTSLKSAPTWNELEQLLDNPYAVVLCSSISGGLLGNTPGNDQGYPSYCSTIVRRKSFLANGQTLPPFLVHPLNYNPTTGERMRLLNPNYDGAPWTVPILSPNPQIVANCPSPSDLAAMMPPVTMTVSPGTPRVDPEEHVIDYNSPITADRVACVPNIEVPEVGFLLGGDPGEPPGYSVAATSGPVSALRLRDPATGTVIRPRAPGTPNGGLAKPSLRVPAVGGGLNRPNYLINSVANLASDPTALVPSNENDYVRDRDAAAVMGKALFWDMQLGSDGVQSCGTCHFHAGADNRVKNQMNPNHLSGDLSFNIRQPNDSLTRSDFPFTRLTNPEISGDPACTPAIVARINAGVLENNRPNGGTFTVCNANNATRRTNDVASSMGVHFGLFKDIPPVGTFVTPASGVKVVPPDLRSDTATAAADNADPIPGFAGSDGSGHQFRRVEPRNTPTIFMAAMNFDNFWDARARHDFNGGSVFGPADPQSHVYAVDPGAGPNSLVATRQIIRFSSLASLTTGPALSEFEMSFLGRNWAKIGKKLLQAGVTPLANQLVAVDDSVLGPYSNQGGSACASLTVEERSPGSPAPGRPGLCISYSGLVERAFYSQLWRKGNVHLNGCYTDGNAALHPNQCGSGVEKDPFDNYVLTITPGAVDPANRDQFTQKEGNFSLFAGLATQLWVTLLVPDDTPFDRMLDSNPDAFEVLGEAGEPGLVRDQPRCTSATQRNCFREVGTFKRDPMPGRPGFGGTRQAGTVDPLLGMDIFFGSNLSLKNPNFRTGRCGECHAAPTLTDNTIPFTFKAQLADFVAEFVPGQPGVEQAIEPLGRNRIISGFLLESELNENGQDGVERRIANQSIAPNPVDGLAYPGGLRNPPTFTGADQGFFDNGVYNLGVTACRANQTEVTGQCDDVGRGGDDAFGWPLSLAALMLKNLGGPNQQPGVPLNNFNPSADPECAPECSDGGLFEETGQDEQVNPGFEGDPENPLLPPYLAPWINNINVGDAQPDLDELNAGINTLTDVPILEGFSDVIGPFNPAGVLNENMNAGNAPIEGSWPMVNRVGRFGSFKAAQLRGVELTGPYFHNGGKLTLRQVVDFYTRGGDFPVTNANHRDFNIMNLNFEVQSNLTEAEKVALVDFLLTLTDARVRFARAPFDHPEVFVPLDGTAPENTFGRDGFLANLTGACAGGTGPCFQHVLAVGEGGLASALPNFLGISSGPRLVGNAANCGNSANNHYCH